MKLESLGLQRGLLLVSDFLFNTFQLTDSLLQLSDLLRVLLFLCQHPVTLFHHFCNELSIVILFERHLIIFLLHSVNLSQKRQQVILKLVLLSF